MSIKVMTTDSTIGHWKNLQAIKKRAEDTLAEMGADIARVDLEYHDFQPKVEDNKLAPRWLGRIIPDERAKRYTNVIFHFTNARAEELGITAYTDKYENTKYGVFLMDADEDVPIEQRLIQFLATNL